MIIYNIDKDMPTDYMDFDNLILEISSQYDAAELLQMLLDGHEFPEDSVLINGFQKGNRPFELAGTNPLAKSTQGYHTVMDRDTLEDSIEYYQRDRLKQPALFREYEQYSMGVEGATPFSMVSVSKEQLTYQLATAFHIMPTVLDSYKGPGENGEHRMTISDLQALSQMGDRLYWAFAGVSKQNRLPSLEDIRFYESLTDYEKRVLNNSTVHPMKLLDTMRELKSRNPKAIFSVNGEELLRREYDGKQVALVEDRPWLRTVAFSLGTTFSTKTANLAYFYISEGVSNSKEADSRAKGVQGALDFDFPEFLQGKGLEKEKYNLYTALAKKGVLTPKLARALKAEEGADNTAAFEELLSYYEEEHYPRFTKKPAEIADYVAKADDRIAPKSVELLEEKFKAANNGVAPRVLWEYGSGKARAMGKTLETLTEQDCDTIVEEFNRASVTKIAAFKNSGLFALDKNKEFNFNEVSGELAALLAVYLTPEILHEANKHGFFQWLKENKNTDLSDLGHLLNLVREGKTVHWEKNLSAKEIKERVENARAVEDCRRYEETYHYNFKDNELAIRGRHIKVMDGDLTMRMLQADEYKNFTVGYPTHCCQHYNGAGESCVWKYTTDPFAGCVVIEDKKGNILAQSFIFTDEVRDTLVFDNIEFTHDEKAKEYINLIANWCKEMPYQNVHMGIGYNTIRDAISQFGRNVGKDHVSMPTTLSNRHIYSDYHSVDDKIIKKDGTVYAAMTRPVRVECNPDEPTRWDALMRPGVNFLLNDYQSSVEDRMAFAERFLNNPTPEVQMEAVQRNPVAILAIENPTEEAQVYAVEQDSSVAGFLRNPCIQVQAILVKENPESVLSMQNPAPEIIRAALEVAPTLLGPLTEKGISIPYDIKKATIEKNGYAIRKLTVEDTQEYRALMQIAIKSRPAIITLLPKELLTDEEYKVALAENPSIAGMLPEHLPDTVFRIAVEKEPYRIADIKHPTERLAKLALRREPLTIRNIQHQFPNLRSFALEKNPYAIRALHKPTEEEWIMACKQKRELLGDIRDRELRSRVEAGIREERDRETTITREEIEK